VSHESLIRVIHEHYFCRHGMNEYSKKVLLGRGATQLSKRCGEWLFGVPHQLSVKDELATSLGQQTADVGQLPRGASPQHPISRVTGQVLLAGIYFTGNGVNRPSGPNSSARLG
jgi:hypothetical protein